MIVINLSSQDYIIFFYETYCDIKTKNYINQLPNHEFPYCKYYYNHRMILWDVWNIFYYNYVFCVYK